MFGFSKEELEKLFADLPPASEPKACTSCGRPNPYPKHDPDFFGEVFKCWWCCATMDRSGCILRNGYQDQK